jgi:hypothetical protein
MISRVTSKKSPHNGLWFLSAGCDPVSYG